MPPLAFDLVFRQLNAQVDRDKLVSVTHRGQVIITESQLPPAQASSKRREGSFLPT